MPRKHKAPPRELPSIPKELIDQLASGAMTAGLIDDLSALLKKALIGRALGAELGQHLVYESEAEKPVTATNQRNGHSANKVLTSGCPLHLQIP